MSSTTACSEEEAQWRQQRAQLYVQLCESGKQGLNRDAVLATRQHFTPGNTFAPKPYAFPRDDDCVALICAEIPADAARVCHSVGEELVALLSRRPDGGAVGYVNERELMHITLFHTSHPNELVPRAKTRRAADTAQLRDMLRGFAKFRVKPVRVLLASSGAIIMLFECQDDAGDTDTDDGSDAAAVTTSGSAFVNANREFSVDRLRKAAKETFKHQPKASGTRTIVHSTLGRILDPDVAIEALARVRLQCEAITARFEAQPLVIQVEKLWYVDETHHFSAQGPKTTFALQ